MSDENEVQPPAHHPLEDLILENAGNARVQLMKWMSGTSGEHPYGFQVQAAEILVHAGMHLQTEWDNRLTYREHMALRRAMEGEVMRKDTVDIEERIRVLEAAVQVLRGQVFQP